MIQAIETLYRGYRFRSRLEARWAVFFDALGLSWKYEAEGYEFPNYPHPIRYLPDFVIQDVGFFEVKGSIPSDEESLKTLLLCGESKDRCYIAVGEIPSPEKPENSIWMFDPYGEGYSDHVGFGRWHQCRKCELFSIGDWESVLFAQCDHDKLDPESNALKEAYRKARSARFEFGDAH
jgi:hypothetical protein